MFILLHIYAGEKLFLPFLETCYTPTQMKKKTPASHTYTIVGLLAAIIVLTSGALYWEQEQTTDTAGREASAHEPGTTIPLDNQDATDVSRFFDTGALNPQSGSPNPQATGSTRETETDNPADSMAHPQD